MRDTAPGRRSEDERDSLQGKVPEKSRKSSCAVVLEAEAEELGERERDGT